MIRVAILGAGIGAEHLDAYRALPDLFDVRVIVDRDMDRAQSLLRPDDTIQIADQIDTALAADVDLIDICLPPHLHVATTLAVLEAGKHAICEKPLATNLIDCDRLQSAAHAADKQVFPVFQYRWGPSLAQMRHLIDAGVTGHAVCAASETHWNRGPDYYAIPWRGTWAGEQGGAVLGHAIHNHDLLTHLLGPVADVSAMTTTRVNAIETEDCAAIALRFASGALATSSITLGAAFDRTRLQITFEHLTATSGQAPYAPGLDPWVFAARDPADQAKIDTIVAQTRPEPVGFVGFLTQIAHAVAGAPNTAVSLADGIASVELVTAIYASARSQRQQTLPLPPDHPMRAGWQPA